MRIVDKLHKKTIIELSSNNKSNIIQELLDYLVNLNYLKRSVKLFSLIDSKELYNSSNIGRGIAFPHSISKEVEDLVCILGISKSGINYDGDDVYPCHLVLLSLSPENNPNIHRKFISKFQLLLSNTELKEKIINFTSSENLEKLLINWENNQIEELL